MSNVDDLAYLPLLDLSQRIHDGALSPVEATEAQLARIKALQPKLNAYATVMAESAMAAARRAEAEIAADRWRGPLHGVPIAVKDLCFTRGVPTAAGMSIHKDFKPDFDATVVARLQLAGAVILGKLQMTEGAYSDHHASVMAPINPWNADYWAGASSSGSGVATAAGLCYGSLGSDTGGSIRFPSSANGVTGLKPSWGRVSRHGVFALADSLDHIGPMTRTAADAAAMLGALAGHDPNDPTTLLDPVPDYLDGIDAGIAGLRIGIDRGLLARTCDAEINANVAQAVEVLAAQGAIVVDVQMPDPRPIADLWVAYCGVETAIAHEATYPGRANEYGTALTTLIEIGRKQGALAHGKAQIERDRFRGSLRKLFASIDLLIMPIMAAAPAPAPSGGDEDIRIPPEAVGGLILFTGPFNMTGSPSLTLPGGFSQAGLPIGFQLIGDHLEEALLCRAGFAYQQVTDWHLARPPI